MMLKPPEYVSFEWLADTMTDIPCRVPGAVKIKIIKQGEGPMVPSKALVNTHFAAYWEHDRQPFSSTFKLCKKAKFQKLILGAGLCLEGIELALTNVRGPTARLMALLAPEVLWKPDDIPPGVRPEPVLFLIALFSVKELHTHNMFYYLKKEEKAKYEVVTATVQFLREKAKGFFQNQRYAHAGEVYDRAFNVICYCRPKTEEEKQAIKDLKVQVLVNAAVCYYKLDQPKRVLTICSRINENIDIDTHCKAVFYKGRAYEKLQQDEEALEQYKKALNLEPYNKEICAAMAALSARINKSKVVESKMWQNVFKKLKMEAENETEEKPKTQAGAAGAEQNKFVVRDANAHCFGVAIFDGD